MLVLDGEDQERSHLRVTTPLGPRATQLSDSIRTGKTALNAENAEALVRAVAEDGGANTDAVGVLQDVYQAAADTGTVVGRSTVLAAKVELEKQKSRGDFAFRSALHAAHPSPQADEIFEGLEALGPPMALSISGERADDIIAKGRSDRMLRFEVRALADEYPEAWVRTGTSTFELHPRLEAEVKRLFDTGGRLNALVARVTRSEIAAPDPDLRQVRDFIARTFGDLTPERAAELKAEFQQAHPG